MHTRPDKHPRPQPSHHEEGYGSTVTMCVTLLCTVLGVLLLLSTPDTFTQMTYILILCPLSADVREKDGVCNVWNVRLSVAVNAYCYIITTRCL